MHQPELTDDEGEASVSEFSHAGATLVAEETGCGSNTLLVMHGLAMGRSVYASLASLLRDRCRFVAIDLPGYGQAPAPVRTLTMERIADLVAAFVRSRGLAPVVLVGHSMGTQVAVELAARHPDLVARVVLVAPTVNKRERSAFMQALRLAQDLAIESPRVFAVGAREYLRAGPRLRSKLHAMLAHQPEDTYPHVVAPALVLRGEYDYVAPREWCRFVADVLADGALTEVEGHGHETMIRDAAPAAASIIAFCGL